MDSSIQPRREHALQDHRLLVEPLLPNRIVGNKGDDTGHCVRLSTPRRRLARLGQRSLLTPERVCVWLGSRPGCSMLGWMALVADEREGAFSTWPWERVRCACSSSPTARF